MDAPNNRILVIDDNPAIHQDFRKVLTNEALDVDELGEMLFGVGRRIQVPTFHLSSAFQGREGIVKLQEALSAGLPYAMAFVDMRMPPGWDGVETVERLWEIDPLLQVVVCTAYSDYVWDEILSRLDVRDRLLILRKPFDAIEARQLAWTLTTKWRMTRQAASKMANLQATVQERTRELQLTNVALRAEIEERNKAEAGLRLAASVFEHTMDGIMVTDTAGTILSVNPAFTVITGYTAEEAVGSKPNLLRSDLQGPDFYRDLWARLLRDGHWEGEIWNRRKNGESFLEWLSIGQVCGDDGKPVRYVGVFNDITEIRRKDEHIRHLAYHDPLTGLPNRALLLNRLEHALAFARRAQQHLGVMFLDLDGFKHINDSLGHNVGDGLLKAVAARLTGCLRAADTVARMGGDEFVILLEHVEAPDICASLAEKLIAALAAPIAVGGLALQVGASIGIACFPEDGLEAVDLMKHADTAMYAAKSGGRGTYRFFQPAMTEKAGQRLKMEGELREAVRSGSLELHYQPKISLATNRVCGVEALVRWRHPTLGLVSPDTFISLAEETGLIGDLGNWVLDEACRQVRAWREEGLGTINVAVNVSAKQVDDGLPERIASLAGKHGISPSALAIELTESAVMAEPEEISNIFGRLRTAGITIAVDDFGTGYSSLAYLRRLPIDAIKIDRSFISRVDSHRGDAEIVRTIVALGNALELEVVAEGVETQGQVSFLQSIGCTTAQGFLYARPLTAAAFSRWMRDRHTGMAAQ